MPGSVASLCLTSFFSLRQKDEVKLKPSSFILIHRETTYYVTGSLINNSIVNCCISEINKDIHVSVSCLLNEPPHVKTSKMTCVPSEDSDQPGHPQSLIRVFAVHVKKHWTLNYLLSAQ